MVRAWRLSSPGHGPQGAAGLEGYFRGRAPPGDMEVGTVLVPVDGSEESTGAVEYAAAVAAEYGALVHVMYVRGGAESRAIEPDDVGADEVADEGLAYIDAVEEVVAEHDVPVTHSIAYGFSRRRLTVHPGSVVLDAAEQMAADFIVVPREGYARPSDVLGKTAEHVLLYASQPVLSV